VSELERFAEAELEDFLGARGERNVARWRLFALTDDLDDFLAHRREIYVEALERLGSNTLALVEQTEEDVLGPYVIVIK
jgi:hypothetical protein